MAVKLAVSEDSFLISWQEEICRNGILKRELWYHSLVLIEASDRACL